MEKMLSLTMVAVFFLGYVLIALEQFIKVNRATIALLMGIICWALQFSNGTFSHEENNVLFSEGLSEIAQVLIFLLGSLAIVEMIQVYGGFQVIESVLKLRSKRKFLWVIGFLTFGLSSILGGITMAVVMISLLPKIATDKEDRLILGSGVVLAANAGGAFSPIGDITTTLLWIGGQISEGKIILDLFLPSLICLILGLFTLQFRLQGDFLPPKTKTKRSTTSSRWMFFWGLALIVFIPVFKILTGLPPFMGMLFGIGIVWLLNDLFELFKDQDHHIPFADLIPRLDFSIPVFFLGLLLSIYALGAAGVFDVLAQSLHSSLPSPEALAIFLGMTSSLIDNVPLVAATTRIYPLQVFPQNHPFWEVLAYTAGVGGSLFPFGSAPGVAFMGLEKASFGWFLKKTTPPAFLGLLGGLSCYMLQKFLFS